MPKKIWIQNDPSFIPAHIYLPPSATEKLRTLKHCMTFICEVVLHICIMCLRHIAHRLWGTWLPITYNCPLRRAGFWICSLAHSCTWAWRWWWQNLEDFIRWIYWICQYRAVINVVEYNLALHCKRNLSQSRPWLPIENMPLGVIACICSYPLYKKHLRKLNIDF